MDNQNPQNSADDQTIQVVSVQPNNQPVSYGVNKESEAPKTKESANYDVKEMDVPKEVEKHVSVTNESIELPPDLKKMGVSTPASTSAVSQVVPSKPINLPLSDDQIGTGLQSQLMTSLRWLAEWCLKQLKVAHLHLKKMGGHFVRESD